MLLASSGNDRAAEAATVRLSNQSCEINVRIIQINIIKI